VWKFVLLLLCGIPIAVSDIRSRRIPNALLIVLFAMTEIELLFHSRNLERRYQWLGILKPNFLFLIFLILAITFVSALPGVIGMGDLKLLAILILVFNDSGEWVSMFFTATCIGLAWGVITRKKSIPFAPSIVIAALIFAF
jgi:Flp pilus assembly protein protease CpaA